MHLGFYYIHEIAEKVGCHPNTIRNYIRRGLIDKPAIDWNGWRLFSEKHIKEIEDLQRLR